MRGAHMISLVKSDRARTWSVAADAQQYAPGWRGVCQKCRAGLCHSLLGFSILYLYNGQPHDYVPDFLISLEGQPGVHLILETKGYDPLAHVKAQAAQRWVAAVNAEGQYGCWHYAIAYKPEEVRWHIEATVTRMREEGTTEAEIA